jgi:hypothetical protein
MNLYPFDFKVGSTVSVAAGAASADLAIAGDTRQLLITNVGTQLVFARIKYLGDASGATVADLPILPNSQLMTTKAAGNPLLGESVLAVIAPGGAGSTVYATGGEGFI